MTSHNAAAWQAERRTLTDLSYQAGGQPLVGPYGQPLALRLRDSFRGEAQALLDDLDYVAVFGLAVHGDTDDLQTLANKLQALADRCRGGRGHLIATARGADADADPVPFSADYTNGGRPITAETPVTAVHVEQATDAGLLADADAADEAAPEVDPADGDSDPDVERLAAELDGPRGRKGRRS